MPTKPSKSKTPAKKKAVAKKKPAAKDTAALSARADADYQPIVYNPPVAKSEVAESSVGSSFAASPSGGMMDSAMNSPKSSAPLSAASLHKSAMSAPIMASAAKPASIDDSEILRDIKPRQNGKDAAFLAPEKFGFDLKKNAPGATGKGKWINVLIYSLSTLIILLTVLLFALTFYSGKVTENKTADLSGQEQPTQTGDQPAQTPVQSGQYKFTITNLPTDLQNVLVQLVKAEFKDNSVAVNNDNADLKLPEVKTDTIFVKQANVAQTNTLMTMLAKYGIKPEIQTKADLPVDASLFFVTTLPKPDLSGLTATVYNASGVSGLAKKNCDILVAYKVSNCQALNATATLTGMTVEYKNVKAFFVLRRTPEFSGAKYSQAGSAQIEDVKVTVGK